LDNYKKEQISNKTNKNQKSNFLKWVTCRNKNKMMMKLTKNKNKQKKA